MVCLLGSGSVGVWCFCWLWGECCCELEQFGPAEVGSDAVFDECAGCVEGVGAVGVFGGAERGGGGDVACGDVWRVAVAGDGAGTESCVVRVDGGLFGVVGERAPGGDEQ
jgi:hypothetical protein